MGKTYTAVVVTYNRRELLIRCIEHLRRQTIKLDNIIVVNNGSTDGTDVWLDNQIDLDVIHQENVGGSGGFYRGIQHAYEKGYDWIWCMDDDVYPEPNCLEMLLKQDDENVGILCPLRKQEGTVFLSEVKKMNMSNPFLSSWYDVLSLKDVTEQETVKIESMSFEGPLIKRKLVEKIGLPEKDYFILYDDTDYSFRATESGFGVFIVTTAILNKELFRSKFSYEEIAKKNKWKLYYHVRNTTYFNKRYGKNFGVKYVRSFFLFLKYELIVLKNCLTNDIFSWADCREFFFAFRDGMRGNLGKYCTL